MIVASGFPKSGCHTLVKAMQLLGMPGGGVLLRCWGY